MRRRESSIVASSRHPGDGWIRQPQARTRAALTLTIVAIASASAASSAHAADDWAAVEGGGADAQMTKRLKAEVRTLPGTDTRYLIGGFVELDGIFTRNKQTSAEQDTFLVSGTPFGHADSEQRASRCARRRSIGFPETPTALGNVTLSGTGESILARSRRDDPSCRCSASTRKLPTCSRSARRIPRS